MEVDQLKVAQENKVVIDKICASHKKNIRQDLANESNKKLAEELKKLNMRASEIEDLKKVKRMEEWSFSGLPYHVQPGKN